QKEYVHIDFGNELGSVEEEKVYAKVKLKRFCHFLKLYDAYIVFFQLAIKELPDNNQKMNIKQKKDSGIPFGITALFRSIHGWVEYRMRSFFQIKSREDSGQQYALVNLGALPHFFQLLSDEDFNNFLILIANEKPVNFNPLNKIDDILDRQNIPDNYIEDKIYDELKLTVQKFFEKGKCSCHSKQSCFEQIGYEKFLARWAEFESLNKNMHDMVIKGQLMAFQKGEDTRKVTNKNRKQLYFGYCYNNDIPVCHDTYLALVGIGHTYLENVKQHLQKHGHEERTHGNTGRAPKNMKRIEVNYDVACDVFRFLKNYSSIYGMPSPGRQFNRISVPSKVKITRQKVKLKKLN
ncbi:2670_t:CDS:2, partial [Gigaspora margarita]